MNRARALLSRVRTQNNILDRLEDVERAGRSQALYQVELGQLANLTDDAGVLQSGEVRMDETGVEPGSGFTGLRIGSPGFEYAGGTWHIAGVNNDILQVGISATDGKLYAIAGNLIADATGLLMQGLSDFITFINGDLVGRIGQNHRTSFETTYGLSLKSFSVAGGIEGNDAVFQNGGFESNDFTYFATTSGTNWSTSIVTSPVYTGTYAGKIACTGSAAVGLKTVRSTINELYTYTAIARIQNQRAGTGSGEIRLDLVFYDATSGGNVLETWSTRLLEINDEWQYATTVAVAPIGTLSCDVIVTVSQGASGDVFYVDDIAIYRSGNTIYADGTTVKDGGIASPVVGHPYGSISPSTTKTSIFSIPIKYASLGTLGCVDVDLPYSYINSTGGTRALTFDVDFGSTNLFSRAISVTAGNRSTGHIAVRMANKPGGQFAICTMSRTNAAQAAGVFSTGIEWAIAWNTASVDTSTAHNAFTISITSNADTATQTFETPGALVRGPYSLS